MLEQAGHAPGTAQPDARNDVQHLGADPLHTVRTNTLIFPVMFCCPSALSASATFQTTQEL